MQGFCDHIEHAWLRRMLAERLDDPARRRLIRKWRRAGGLEPNGQVVHPATGTPPGGTASPILAHVDLHDALDRWVEKVGKPQCKGEAGLIRDADDRAPRRRGKEAVMVTSPQPGGTRDGGRPAGAGVQEQAPNHLQPQQSRATVVSVRETAGQSPAGEDQADERQCTAADVSNAEGRRQNQGES
jgi:hypothetical protein